MKRTALELSLARKTWYDTGLRVLKSFTPATSAPHLPPEILKLVAAHLTGALNYRSALHVLLCSRACYIAVLPVLMRRLSFYTMNTNEFNEFSERDDAVRHLCSLGGYLSREQRFAHVEELLFVVRGFSEPLLMKLLGAALPTLRLLEVDLTSCDEDFPFPWDMLELAGPLLTRVEFWSPSESSFPHYAWLPSSVRHVEVPDGCYNDEEAVGGLIRMLARAPGFESLYFDSRVRQPCAWMDPLRSHPDVGSKLRRIALCETARITDFARLPGPRNLEVSLFCSNSDSMPGLAAFARAAFIRELILIEPCTSSLRDLNVHSSLDSLSLDLARLDIEQFAYLSHEWTAAEIYSAIADALPTIREVIIRPEREELGKADLEEEVFWRQMINARIQLW
ncbi:hypothetical protein DFJ74DRAFT_530049 [Hyaloraphidium curvatum]|nr:hypothetical protein DFJ74DRAFT_530049 [Hyaloraphidium curvatum]